MSAQDPELSAALGWPGGISDPVLDRTRLLQMVAALMQDKLWEDHRVKHLWDHVQEQAEPVQEQDVEDAIEAAYWHFDARKKGLNEWAYAPQSERDAFKAEARKLVRGYFPTRQAQDTKREMLAVADAFIRGKRSAQEQAEPDHETRAEIAEQQVVQLAEERDHYRHLWQRAQQAEPRNQCRRGGRCQYAIDHGAEGMGHCPKGKCVVAQHTQPAEDRDVAQSNLRVMKEMFREQAEPEQPGAWVASKDGRVIYDDASTDDGLLRVSGDFENDEQRVRYAQRIVDKLNAAPPQRTMVPLTEDEIHHATGHCGVSRYTAINIARAVEKASWEKNHGQA